MHVFKKDGEVSGLSIPEANLNRIFSSFSASTVLFWPVFISMEQSTYINNVALFLKSYNTSFETVKLKAVNGQMSKSFSYSSSFQGS